MNLKIGFSISDFEPIAENSEKKLVGGFSLSHTAVGISDFNTTNNCEGGNCASGCGDGPIGQNKGCNVSPGCGAIKVEQLF